MFDKLTPFRMALCAGLCAAALGAIAQTKPLTPVTIAVATPVINVTYPWITLPISLGYWRSEGLDVKIVTVGGSLQGVQQMVAGGADFAQINSTSLIQSSVENGVQVRAIMGNGNVDWGLAVMDDNIKSISDFKGKKIGVLSLGTGGVPLLRAYLKKAGLDPVKDVQIIATGAGAPALEALRTGRVNGLMFWASAITGFENAGAKLRVLHDPAWRQLPDYTMATMQGTIDKRPEVVAAIVRGAAKATLYAWTNPECARQSHWKNYPSTKPTGADEATLARWDLALLNTQLASMKGGLELSGGNTIGALSVPAYARMQDFMLQESIIKSKGDVNTMLYTAPSFVKEIGDFDRDAVVTAAKACK